MSLKKKEEELLRKEDELEFLINDFQRPMSNRSIEGSIMMKKKSSRESYEEYDKNIDKENRNEQNLYEY